MRPALFLTLGLLLGCSKTEPAPASSPEVPVANKAKGGPKPATEDEPAKGKDEPKTPGKDDDDKVAKPQKAAGPVVYALAATIGKGEKIRLYLERNGDELSGLYVPEAGGLGVPLKGKTKADDKFVLEERDEKGKVVGTYDGWLRDGKLKGTYTDAKSKKAQVFVTEPLSIGKEPFKATYSGALGGKLRIRAKLERAGEKLSGVYRYARSKSDLVLEGTVAPNGDVALDESVKGGKKTGRIEGVLLSQHLLVGRWFSPDKSKSMSLLLEPSNGYPEIVDLGGVKLAPQEDVREIAKNCSSSRMWPSVEGAKGKAALDAAIRKEQGVVLTKSDCEGATSELPYTVEETYTVTRSKLPYFGLTFSMYQSAGGAHPSWAATCKVANADTGELFALATKLSPEARAKLSALVMANLKKQHSVDKLTEAGFFEDDVVVSEKTNVCLSEGGGLSVEFNPYEIGPWVLGPSSVSVGKDDAKALLPSDLVVLAR